MATQSAVLELEKLGRLPCSSSPDIEIIEKFQSLLTQVRKPVSDDDARILVQLFGPDDCFGLAWTLLHLIETSYGWPLQDCLKGSSEWVKLLGQRVNRVEQ
jgi:hypothetical protein